MSTLKLEFGGGFHRFTIDLINDTIIPINDEIHNPDYMIDKLWKHGYTREDWLKSRRESKEQLKIWRKECRDKFKVVEFEHESIRRIQHLLKASIFEVSYR